MAENSGERNLNSGMSEEKVDLIVSPKGNLLISLQKQKAFEETFYSRKRLLKI